MADVTPEQAHWMPPGMALPLDAIYAHGVTTEDFTTNKLLKGGEALNASTYADTSGIREPGPYFAPERASDLRIDLPAAHRYAQAVYDATDDYLADLSGDALDAHVDLSSEGWGTWPLHVILTRFVIGHIDRISPSHASGRELPS